MWIGNLFCPGGARLDSRSSSTRGGELVINFMFYTYVLKSINFNKFYTGYTENLEKRLFEHNSMLNTYSRRYAPWKVKYFEKFDNQETAIQREKYFKSAAGRKWLKKNVENSNM